MNDVRVVGIAQSDALDDRTLILLSVSYNGENFSWSIRMPRNFIGSFQDFANSKAESIYSDIQNKLDQWNNLDPKTRDVLDHDTNTTYPVPITREEIVKPTYPDYYILRAREYPQIAEQLDAFWKGELALEAMKNTIANIKSKYPKQ